MIDAHNLLKHELTSTLTYLNCNNFRINIASNHIILSLAVTNSKIALESRFKRTIFFLTCFFF